MKKLKVTWQDGSWNHGGDQPIAETSLPHDVRINLLGETLVFTEQSGDGAAMVLLAVPESRLISSAQVEASDA